MTIQLDTSALVDALAGPRRELRTLLRFIDQDQRPTVSTIAVYEWQRGPREPIELETQEVLLPSDRFVVFGAEEADLAARLYKSVRRPRGRDLDLAIAACAIVHGAALWTTNRSDFADIPGLRLV
jgi:predicted nucleic acid-binding protein